MKYPAIISLFLLFSCADKNEIARVKNKYTDLLRKGSGDAAKVKTTGNPDHYPQNSSSVLQTRRDDIVKFAYQFIGTPYIYGSSDPETGFDCSGFISYTYTHFGYQVPRSSKDFLHFGREIPLENVQKGDLLIFYGTDTELREIGHIGIVSQPAGAHSDFIHASSGKANGVTVSSLSSPHYTARFVKAISVLD